jgi:hypothetical protein
VKQFFHNQMKLMSVLKITVPQAHQLVAHSLEDA